MSGMSQPGSRDIYSHQDPSQHSLVENCQAKILWDLLIQTDKQVVANQADIAVMEKEQKRMMMEVEVPSGLATST